MADDDVDEDLLAEIQRPIPEWYFECISMLGDVAIAVANALKVNSTVKKVTLRWNGLGAEGAKLIADALKGNTTVHTIRISCNGMGNDGAKAVAEAIEKNSTVQRVDLDDNGIGKAGAEAIAEAIKKNSTVQIVDLDDNEIGDEGATFIADALKENSTLQEVHLCKTCIGSKGAEALGEALKKNFTVQTILLCGNNIGSEGAKYIAKGLMGNSTVKTVDLRKNEIGDKGARFIADALKGNTTVQKIILYENEIGEKGARFIADALKGNTTVQEILLCGNDIHDEGAKFIAQALAKNSMVKTVDLRCNGIGNEGAKAMESALQVNSTVQTVELGIVDDGLSKLLERNRKLTGSPTEWDQDTVAFWLVRIGLGEFSSIFIEHGCSGRILMALNNDDFDKLGLGVGHRKQFLRELSKLEANHGEAESVKHVNRYNRMEDGIKEAVSRSSSICFYPQNYAPHLTARDFVDSLPEDRFPKELIKRMLTDFKIEMMRTMSVLQDHQSPLSEADVFAIFTYSYELKGNKFQIYSEMNRVMRQQVSLELDFWRPLIFHLHCALDKLVVCEYTAYRGVAVEFNRELYSMGKDVVWPAFSSASMSREVAKVFMEEHKNKDPNLMKPGTMFILKAKSARRVLGFSHFPEEEEVLFPPNSVFRVTSRVTPDTKDVLNITADVIEMEQVVDSTPTTLRRPPSP